MHRHARWGLYCVTLSLLWGCPSEVQGPVADVTTSGDADTSAAESTRAYLMGGWAESVVLSAGTLSAPERMSADALDGAGDIELLVVPLDLHGVPWDAFDGPDNQPTELPAEWLKTLTDAEELIASLRARAGLAEARSAAPLEVVLSLSPITRDGKALQPGTMELSGKAPQWENCFNPALEADPTRYGARYAGYVTYLTSRLNPSAVILGRVVNRYEVHCGKAAYDAILDVIHAAHDRLKGSDAPVQTILEVDVEDLYGLPKRDGRCVGVAPEACFEERSVLLDGVRTDALGLHAMPAIALEEMAMWPPDWLDRVVQASPTAQAVVSATSLGATSLSAQLQAGGPCIERFASDEVQQRAWLRTLQSSAEALDMPWVAWHPLRDLVSAEVSASCPCAGDEEVCFYFDHVVDERAFAMRRLVGGGLWSVDGQARLGGQEWELEVQP